MTIDSKGFENREIHIARMVESDIEAVKIIESEGGLAAWSFDDYTKEVKRRDSISLVATCQKQIIGFLVARLIMFKEDFNECEIYNLAVKKKFRKKGIGQHLFNKFLLEIKPACVWFVWLEVRQTNYPAIEFYKKNGFEETGIRKHFYSFPTENALLMKLDLTM